VDIEVRAARPDELERFRRLFGLAFGFDPRPEDHERFVQLVERERTRCAFDHGEMVGTSGAFSLELTVPGGVVPCAGTSFVTVMATHRRRGILRAMMDALLDDAAARGEPISALWASEAAIYGRFGYGPATDAVEVAISRSEHPLHRLAPHPAAVEFVDADEARALFPAIFEQLRPLRPGFSARSDLWWEDRHFHEPAPPPQGATSQRYAVARDDAGSPTGYVRYRMKAKWEEHRPASEIQVGEMMCLTPEAAAGLWQLLLTHDLVATVVAHDLPTDAALFGLVADLRSVRRIHHDGLWVRVLDVPAALGARRYRTSGSFVFEVSDPLGRVDGVYRLDIDDDGTARCAPTDAAADLRMDLEDLGAAYLGRPRFAAALRTGRLHGDAEAAAAADVAFSWDPAPWCPELF